MAQVPSYCLQRGLAVGDRQGRSQSAGKGEQYSRVAQRGIEELNLEIKDF
jgi:hypothetical protein